jgi:DNA-binding XRE family transcriptional regulator
MVDFNTQAAAAGRIDVRTSTLVNREKAAEKIYWQI